MRAKLEEISSWGYFIVLIVTSTSHWNLIKDWSNTFHSVYNNVNAILTNLQKNSFFYKWH